MNESNLYDYVMRCLTTLRYTRKEVAEGSGVPFSTVCKVAQRSVREPSVHTVQAMADFFRRELDKQASEQKEAA
jgi:transcriptional regulator with XRE-family HTH domain